MANLPSITVTDGDRVISSALDISDPALHDGIKAVVTNATSRWLKNEEVLTVLESFQVEGVVWPKEASEKPDGGKLFLFHRKVCRAFRSDKHNWRKKQDGRTVKETHEKLKVGDKERLNCYYAHAEDSDGLQRRCYWILDQPKDNVVLVHYLCSTTSRAGQRSGAPSTAASLATAAAANAAAGGGPFATMLNGGGSSDGGGGVFAGPAAPRPQRAAAQRARYVRYGDYAVDSDDEGALDGDDDDSRGTTTTTTATTATTTSGGDLVQPPLSHFASAPAPPPLSPHQQQQQQNNNLPESSNLLPLPSGSLDLNTAMSLGKICRFDSLPTGVGLPSLAEQDAAARNGGNLPLGGNLPFLLGTSSKTPYSRRLIHDPLGSSDGPLLFSQMSLHIDQEHGGLQFSSEALESQDLLLQFNERKDSSGEQILLGGGADATDELPLKTDMSLDLAGATSLDLLRAGAVGGGGGEVPHTTTTTTTKSTTTATAGIESNQGPFHPGVHQDSSTTNTNQTIAPQRVETLRRLVAPGFRHKSGSNQSLADVARRSSGGGGGGGGTTASDDDSPAGAAHRRKNPTAAPSPLSGQDRVAAAALAAAHVTAERREEQLQQLRQARQVGAAAAGDDDDDGGEILIDTMPNPLFRLTSHVVRFPPMMESQALADEADAQIAAMAAVAAAANAVDAQNVDETLFLMKEMSMENNEPAQMATLDAVAAAEEEEREERRREEERAAARGVETASAIGLLRNMSIDERHPALAEAAVEELEQKRLPNRGAVGGSFESVDEERWDAGGGATTGTGTATPSGTTSENQSADAAAAAVASRDPSLSSLLDATLSMHGSRVPSATTATGRGGGSPGKSPTDDILMAAFAEHQSRAAAKVAERAVKK